MAKLIVCVTWCIIALAVGYSYGAVVSPEYFDGFESNTIDKVIPENFNSTEFFLALKADHPHASLTVPEIVRLYGYGVEIHAVMTHDDYVLEIHRITGNKNNTKPDGKPVIFLQHGLLSSSVDWVIAGPGRGFGFILADAGYDVWMGNVRGNKYSRNHKSLTVKDKEYWDFDWHEIGTVDLPKMIDYVLNVTGRSKLFYAGHSQGSTAFFVMTSELPAYNNKISAMFSLAPVAYCSRMFSPVFQFLAAMIKPIDMLASFIGAYEFQPTNKLFQKFTSVICGEGSILQPICSNVMFLIAGFNVDQLDTTLLPAIFSHLPAGASVKQFTHYAQIIRSGKFRQLDLGISGNLVKYRSFLPPVYNLKNVKAPVALHYSVNDWLSASEDVQKLYSQLPNPIGKFRVVHDKFNHFDYVWAKDVKKLLYNKIISLMTRYKN